MLTLTQCSCQELHVVYGTESGGFSWRTAQVQSWLCVHASLFEWGGGLLCISCCRTRLAECVTSTPGRPASSPLGGVRSLPLPHRLPLPLPLPLPQQPASGIRSVLWSSAAIACLVNFATATARSLGLRPLRPRILHPEIHHACLWATAAPMCVCWRLLRP